MMAGSRTRLRAPRRCAHEDMVAAVVGADTMDHVVLATEAPCGRRPRAAVGHMSVAPAVLTGPVRVCYHGDGAPRLAYPCPRWYLPLPPPLRPQALSHDDEHRRERLMKRPEVSAHSLDQGVELHPEPEGATPVTSSHQASIHQVHPAPSHGATMVAAVAVSAGVSPSITISKRGRTPPCASNQRCMARMSSGVVARNPPASMHT